MSLLLQAARFNYNTLGLITLRNVSFDCIVHVLDHFRALKPSLLEHFRALEQPPLEPFRALKPTLCEQFRTLKITTLLENFRALNCSIGGGFRAL